MYFMYTVDLNISKYTINIYLSSSQELYCSMYSYSLPILFTYYNLSHEIPYHSFSSYPPYPILGDFGGGCPFIRTVEICVSSGSSIINIRTYSMYECFMDTVP